MLRLIVVAHAVVLLAAAPTPTATALRADATPSPTTAMDDPGSLAAMLARLPALPFGGDASPMVSYSNIADQLVTVGAAAPDAAGDEAVGLWTRAVGGLMLPHTATYANRPDWREAFGFDFFQVDQAVEYAAPPLYVTLLRGRFDATELRAAWEREGYRPVKVDGGTIFSVRDDLEIDFDSASGRLAQSSMNHAAMLGDGTLAFASVRETLRLVLEIDAGRQSSFADDVGIAPLLDRVPPDLVSALLVPGSMLAGSMDPAVLLPDPTPGVPDVESLATRIAVEAAERRRMPPVVAALLGMTAGEPLAPPVGQEAVAVQQPRPGAPEATLVVALVMIHRAAAETASSVVAERLATQRVPPIGSGAEGPGSYAELFPRRSVWVADEEPVVLIELVLEPGTPRDILVRLLTTRSLSFVAWSP